MLGFVGVGSVRGRGRCPGRGGRADARRRTVEVGWFVGPALATTEAGEAGKAHG